MNNTYIKDAMKICVIVVTFNRKDLLKKCISSLRNQSVPLSDIIVVNNGCTDGTKDWLEEQSDLISLHQQNLGGAGGFYAGMHYCYERKVQYDWFWLMDDDVRPHPDCLEKLLANIENNIGILVPVRYQRDNLFICEHKRLNYSNPFGKRLLEKVRPEELSNKVDVQCATFEGPFIKRDVITAIGFPTKELFIFNDDVEYSYKAIKAGFRITMIPEAKMEREYIAPQERYKLLWRLYYMTRNLVYLDRVYGQNWLVKYIRPIIGLLKFLIISIPMEIIIKRMPLVTLQRIPVYIGAFYNGMLLRLKPF